MDLRFINLCSKGNLLGAQQHLQLYPNMDISAQNEEAFHWACNLGHLEMAQWLFQISKERGHYINISAINDWVFRVVCGNGHLHVAQWLLQIKPDINISAKNEEAFRWACFYDYLAVAQWLFQVSKERGKTINISAEDEYAFRWSCINGHLAVAQWLQSLKPYLYVINYDENGEYQNCYIRCKKEANWEKRKYLLYIASDCKEDNLLYRLPCDVAKIMIGYV